VQSKNFMLVARYKILVRFVENAPSGGHGIQGKTATLGSLYEWAPSNKPFIKYLDKHLLDHFLMYIPLRYQLQFECDPGFLVLLHLSQGITKYCLCEDCRTPLPLEGEAREDYEEDGCPVCGDYYPTDPQYTIDVKNIEKMINIKLKETHCIECNTPIKVAHIQPYEGEEEPTGIPIVSYDAYFNIHHLGYLCMKCTSRLVEEGIIGTGYAGYPYSEEANLVKPHKFPFREKFDDDDPDNNFSEEEEE